MSSVLLTTREIRELKIMCANPFLELGMTLRPKHLKCFKPHIVTHSMRVIIKFEKHEHAIKWNKMHEARIRNGGHLATFTLSTLVYMLGGGAARAIATSATAGILKDEAQARIWYPKMFKGWLLTRHFIFRYEQFPRKHFYMKWTDVIQDETGKEVEKRKHGQTHMRVDGMSGIPDEIVRNIMTRHPLHTFSYK
jgi:hypothetical protein